MYDAIKWAMGGYQKLRNAYMLMMENTKTKKIKGCIEQNNKLIYPTSVTKYVRISDSQPYAQAY